MYWILDVPVFVGTRPVPSTQQDTMSSVIIRIYAVLQLSPCSESDASVRNGESRQELLLCIFTPGGHVAASPAPPMRWGSGQGTIVWRWRVWGWVGRDSDRLSCAARTRLAAALASAQTKERWPPSIHFNSHVQTQRRTRPQWWGRGWGGCRPAQSGS